MTNVLKSIFCKKKVSFPKLLAYGFQPDEKKGYIFSKTLKDSGFILTVQIKQNKEIFSEVIDPSSNEPYTLHLTDNAAGSFVGGIRSEYEETLLEIAEKCFEPDIFKTAQAKQIIEYVRNTYEDELEFLWQKFPDNAIWRRKDNKKWYGAILTVSRSKLGLESNEIVEVIDLRYPPDKLKMLVDEKRYFPGWHMNKKHWFTIILDGSVATEEIQTFINTSYQIAGKQH